MEHALLRTVKALASLLMIFTMISIIVLDTLLPEHSEPHSLNRILEQNFTPSDGHSVEVSEVSSKNRKRSKAEASKFSTAKNHDAVGNVEVKGKTIVIPLETSTTRRTGASKRTITTIKSDRSSSSLVSTGTGTSSLTAASSSKSSGSGSSSDGIFSNGLAGDRIHITRYRRSNPELAHVTHFESIYDPLIKARNVRHFPYILCEGWGLINEPTRAPVMPTPPPTRAPVIPKIEPTAAPIIRPTQRPVVIAPVLSSSTSLKSNKFLKRLAYQGSIDDVRLYGKARRFVHRPGAFGPNANYLLPVVETRAPIIPETQAPTMEATRAPTPLPTPRVFHKICQDGRVREIEGTQGPTILPTAAPTFAPFSMETRPPAFVGYVWGNGYGTDDNNAPKWSFTKSDGKLLFDHPNLEKAIYRGDFARVRREFRRRVDTMSPW